MIELGSGMPAHQFGDESSLSARVRSGSRLKRFLCFVSIDVRYFRLPPRCLPVPPGYTYPRLKATVLDNRIFDFFLFGIPFYLQSVQVHSANCVMLQRRVEERSVALLHI
jgi:hypothetical protein